MSGKCYNASRKSILDWLVIGDTPLGFLEHTAELYSASSTLGRGTAARCGGTDTALVPSSVFHESED